MHMLVFAPSFLSSIWFQDEVLLASCCSISFHKEDKCLGFVPPTASGRRHHLQQRVAKRHQLQLCDSIHLEQEQLSTFQVFETSVLNRNKEYQQAHDGDSHSLPLVRQRDASSVVTMSFIQDMLHLSDYERMKQLASIMNENGGYLIIQLNNEEANVLTDMWKCIENIQFPGTSSSGDENASLFRRQVLTRNDTESNASGYQHIETAMWREDFTLSVAGDKGNNNLETILGACETDNIAQAFKLILDVSTAIVSMCVMSLNSDDDKD